MGRSLEDVRAIVLTHGHTDHVGYAERARRERGWRVLVHEADEALAKHEVPNPAQQGRMQARPARWGSCGGACAAGSCGCPRSTEVATFGDGATLDLPGAPRWSWCRATRRARRRCTCPAHDALFVGDAMAHLRRDDGRSRPADRAVLGRPDRALASLARLEPLDARLVLPGHGDAFTGGAAEAVRLAREAEAAAG